MPSYLPVKAIRSMTYAELERWWEVDFDVLASTAVAEATGDVHPSVREALASDDWLEQWADALFAGIGELLSSAERMEYTGDARLARTRRRSGLVQARMQHVRILLGKLSKEQGLEMAPAPNRYGRAAALSILGKHHKDELSEIRDAELARQGLPKNGPLYDVSYQDAFEAVEDAVARGYVAAPLTPEVRGLLALPREAVKRKVAKDANRQEDRNDALRHPLTLREWSACLRELLETHAGLSGVEPSFTVTLPSVDMGELRRMPEEEARKLLNRRRFIRSLAQRNQECEMHKRQLVRQADVRRKEAERPWRESAERAREEIARRYPEEFSALMKALMPYCDADTTEFLDDAMSPLRRSQFIRELKTKLADGTLLGR